MPVELSAETAVRVLIKLAEVVVAEPGLVEQFLPDLVH
jgi:hypothetical protein